ncbi:hypothetical protein OKW45_004617 [Paraburkholderia sp. WSM4175]
MPQRNRFFLAQADGFQLRPGHAKRFQFMRDGLRASLSQSETVFGGAALVGVGLYQHLLGRMPAQAFV